MIVAFVMNNVRYIAPDKRQAEAFLAFWGDSRKFEGFDTTWSLETVERAPSYAQLIQVDMSKVEYGKKEMA
jgi:hypothetical protein